MNSKSARGESAPQTDWTRTARARSWTCTLHPVTLISTTPGHVAATRSRILATSAGMIPVQAARSTNRRFVLATRDSAVKISGPVMRSSCPRKSRAGSVRKTLATTHRQCRFTRLHRVSMARARARCSQHHASMTSSTEDIAVAMLPNLAPTFELV